MKNTYFLRLCALLAISLFSPYALSQPAFTKAFTPDTIGPGSVSTLRFDIVSDGESTADDLDFTDVLPGGVGIASPASITNSCGGSINVDADSISLSDGVVGLGQSCSITVNVTSSTPGEGPYTNTSGDLTSSQGNSGAATADLTVDEDLPGFTKSFDPASVDFGGRSTLTFTIDNTTECGECAPDIEDLVFTDNLPSGMVVADPANASTDCGNPALTTLTAEPGASIISLFTNGLLPSAPALEGESSCTVSVDVIGGAVGPLGNTSGGLVIDLNDGTSVGSAAAVLDVTQFDVLLELAKQFIDDPVAPGGTTTLQFTVSNRSRDEAATNISFDDDLATTLAGLTPTLPSLPDPPCGAGSTLDFNLGVLSLTGGNLAPESSCTFSVELSVPAGAAPGSYPNSAGPVSGDLGGAAEFGNSAGDLLFVVSFPVLTKEFTDDPVGSDDTVTLEFTVTNPEPTSAMSAIEFTDELTDGTLVSGEPTGGFLPFPVSVTLPPVPDPPCGPGSTLALVSLGSERQGLELTGGSLAAAGMAGDSCTFSVTVDIPAGLPGGVYTNTTGPISGVLDDIVGTPTTVGPGASDDIVVVGGPQFSKEFTDDPVVPGGTVTLDFTLENLDNVNAASAIAFNDNLGATLTSLTLDSVLVNDCGGTVAGTGTDSFAYSGGSLAAGASCAISLSLTVPTGVGGVFNNTTSDLSAVLGGITVASPAASDELTVSGLLFSKEFSDDPAVPGGTTTLRFTLDNVGAVDTTGITFTDNLAAILPGTDDVTALGLPLAACGGTLSALIPTFVQFTDGSVMSSMDCSFDVTLMVPAAAEPGSYNNVTSGVSSNLGAGPPAVDALVVNSTLLEVTKAFTDDPVAPGDSVSLSFTLTNLSTTETVTDIAFDDDLDAALAGLEASGATANTCGGMAAGFPAGLFEYSGGSLPPGASCNITLDVDVPDSPLPGGPYINTVDNLTGKVGALDISGDPASDELRLKLLDFSKSFDGPTTASATAELTFTIENLDSGNAVNGLSFSDDLDAVLTGLVATGLPAAPCGPGSTLAGTSFLSLNGGNLPASGMCSFDVTVTVPLTATTGAFPNTSSQLFSNGLTVAEPASANLVIEPGPTFAKAFAPASITAGASTTLTFTVDNTASALAATGLAFVDNFPAGLVIASPPNASTTCSGGTLTAVAGSGVLSYTGGTVAAGASCIVQVDTTSATAGALVNTSGDLTSSSGNSGTASDTLTVTANAAPLFSKSFTPGAIDTGDTSQLLLTIDNTASTLAASALAFVDNFPAGLVIASPPNASTTCSGGTLTAVAGSGVLSYTGGTVAAGASCTVQADVTSPLAGPFVNTTGDLSSSAGNSGTASDTLAVTMVPVVTSYTGTLPSGNEGTLSFDPEAGCTLVPDPVFSTPATPPPPGVELVDGVISFVVEGCTPGATLTFTMDYGTELDPAAGYWKYRPPWFLLPGSVVDGSTITFSITDGGPGDLDGTVDGRITDPGGAAVGSPVPAAPIPVTGLLGVWLLACLMMLTGLIAYRRLHPG